MLAVEEKLSSASYTLVEEKLFPAIARLQPVLAGKLTGMFFELDEPSVLLTILEAEQQLKLVVDKLLTLLETAKLA